MREEEQAAINALISDKDFCKKLSSLSKRLEDIEALHTSGTGETAGKLVERIFSQRATINAYYPQIVLDAVYVIGKLKGIESGLPFLPRTPVIQKLVDCINEFLQFQLNLDLGALKKALNDWEANPAEKLMGAPKYGFTYMNVYNEKFRGSGRVKYGRSWVTVTNNLVDAINQAALGAGLSNIIA